MVFISSQLTQIGSAGSFTLRSPWGHSKLPGWGLERCWFYPVVLSNRASLAFSQCFQGSSDLLPLCTVPFPVLILFVFSVMRNLGSLGFLLPFAHHCCLSSYSLPSLWRNLLVDPLCIIQVPPSFMGTKESPVCG